MICYIIPITKFNFELVLFSYQSINSVKIWIGPLGKSEIDAKIIECLVKTYFQTTSHIAYRLLDR